jgi:hypothetical protein
VGNADETPGYEQGKWERGYGGEILHLIIKTENLFMYTWGFKDSSFLGSSHGPRGLYLYAPSKLISGFL